MLHESTIGFSIFAIIIMLILAFCSDIKRNENNRTEFCMECIFLLVIIVDGILRYKRNIEKY